MPPKTIHDIILNGLIPNVIKNKNYVAGVRVALASKPLWEEFKVWRKGQCSISKKMDGRPRPKQVFVLYWIAYSLKFVRSIACIMETSFGKTILAMETALNNVVHGNVVIVTPHTGAVTWVTEIKKFYDNYNPGRGEAPGDKQIIYYASSVKGKHKKYIDEKIAAAKARERDEEDVGLPHGIKNKVIIVSGDSFEYSQVVIDLNPYMIIVDEPHRLPKRNETLNEAARKGRWKVLLLDASAPKKWSIDRWLISKSSGADNIPIPTVRMIPCKGLSYAETFARVYREYKDPYTIVLMDSFKYPKIEEKLYEVHATDVYKMSTQAATKLAKFEKSGGVLYSTIHKLAESINLTTCKQLHLINVGGSSLATVRQCVNRVLRTTSVFKEIDVYVYIDPDDPAQVIRTRLAHLNISGIDVVTSVVAKRRESMPDYVFNALTSYELIMIFCDPSGDLQHVVLDCPYELQTITPQQLFEYRTCSNHRIDPEDE